MTLIKVSSLLGLPLYRRGQKSLPKFHRPSNAKIAKQFESQFPKLNLLTIKDFGGWDKAQATHLRIKGTFDQIYSPKIIVCMNPIGGRV